MEVPHNRVFEKVEDGITQEHKEGRLSPHRAETLRDELEEHEREYEPRAQRQQIFLNAPGPLLPHEDEAPPDDLRGGRNEPEQDDCERHT